MLCWPNGATCICGWPGCEILRMSPETGAAAVGSAACAVPDGTAVLPPLEEWMGAALPVVPCRASRWMQRARPMKAAALTVP